jgi:hypothetical protein
VERTGTQNKKKKTASGGKQSKGLISSDLSENQKLEYLSLAKKFHVPIECVIKHYDTLSKTDT